VALPDAAQSTQSLAAWHPLAPALSDESLPAKSAPIEVTLGTALSNFVCVRCEFSVSFGD